MFEYVYPSYSLEFHSGTNHAYIYLIYLIGILNNFKHYTIIIIIACVYNFVSNAAAALDAVTCKQIV